MTLQQKNVHKSYNTYIYIYINIYIYYVVAIYYNRNDDVQQQQYHNVYINIYAHCALHRLYTVSL